MAEDIDGNIGINVEGNAEQAFKGISKELERTLGFLSEVTKKLGEFEKINLSNSELAKSLKDVSAQIKTFESQIGSKTRKSIDIAAKNANTRKAEAENESRKQNFKEANMPKILEQKDKDLDARILEEKRKLLEAETRKAKAAEDSAKAAEELALKERKIADAKEVELKKLAQQQEQFDRSEARKQAESDRRSKERDRDADLRKQGIEQKKLDQQLRAEEIQGANELRNAKSKTEQAKTKYYKQLEKNAAEGFGYSSIKGGPRAGMAMNLIHMGTRFRGSGGLIGLAARTGEAWGRGNGWFGRTFGKARKDENGNISGGLLSRAFGFDKVTKSGLGLNMGAVAMGSAAVAVGTLTKAIFDFRKSTLDAYAGLEKLSTNLEVVFGSRTKSAETFEGIKSYAVKSPFGIEQTTEMAILLKQSGVYASDLQKTLEMIGDVSGGNEEKMKRIANNYAQIQAIGKASMLDMRQFAYAGLPIYEEVAKTMKGMGMGNVTQQALRSLISEGKVSAEIIEETFRRMTSAGGTFHGAVNKGAETRAAKITNYEDKKAIANSYWGDYFWNTGRTGGTSAARTWLGMKESWQEQKASIGQQWAVNQRHDMVVGQENYLEQLKEAYRQALADNNEPQAEALAERINVLRSFGRGEDEIRAGRTEKFRLDHKLNDKEFVSEDVYAALAERVKQIYMTQATDNRTKEFVYDKETGIEHYIGFDKKETEAYIESEVARMMQAGSFSKIAGLDINGNEPLAELNETLKELNSMLTETALFKMLTKEYKNPEEAKDAFATLTTVVQNFADTVSESNNKIARSSKSLMTESTKWENLYKQSDEYKEKQKENEKKEYEEYSKRYDEIASIFDKNMMAIAKNATTLQIEMFRQSGFATTKSVGLTSESLDEEENRKRLNTNANTAYTALKALGGSRQTSLDAYNAVQRIITFSNELGYKADVKKSQDMIIKAAATIKLEAKRLRGLNTSEAKGEAGSLENIFDVITSTAEKADYSENIRGSTKPKEWIPLWMRIFANNTGMDAHQIKARRFSKQGAMDDYLLQQRRQIVGGSIQELSKAGVSAERLSGMYSYGGMNAQGVRQIDWKKTFTDMTDDVMSAVKGEMKERTIRYERDGLSELGNQRLEDFANKRAPTKNKMTWEEWRQEYYSTGKWQGITDLQGLAEAFSKESRKKLSENQKKFIDEFYKDFGSKDGNYKMKEVVDERILGSGISKSPKELAAMSGGMLEAAKQQTEVYDRLKTAALTGEDWSTMKEHNRGYEEFFNNAFAGESNVFRVGDAQYATKYDSKKQEFVLNDESLFDGKGLGMTIKELQQAITLENGYTKAQVETAKKLSFDSTGLERTLDSHRTQLAELTKNLELASTLLEESNSIRQSGLKGQAESVGGSIATETALLRAVGFEPLKRQDSKLNKFIATQMGNLATADVNMSYDEYKEKYGESAVATKDTYGTYSEYAKKYQSALEENDFDELVRIESEFFATFKEGFTNLLEAYKDSGMRDERAKALDASDRFLRNDYAPGLMGALKNGAFAQNENSIGEQVVMNRLGLSGMNFGNFAGAFAENAFAAKSRGNDDFDTYLDDFYNAAIKEIEDKYTVEDASGNPELSAEGVEARNKLNIAVDTGDFDEAKDALSGIENGFENANNAAVRMASGISEVGKQFQELGKQIAGALENFASDAITSTMSTWGKVMAENENASEAIKDNFKALGASLASNLGTMMTEAGLQMIIGSAGDRAMIMGGLALIAAGGAASFLSGLLSGDKGEDTEENEWERLNRIKDDLTDLLKQAREDAIYYENTLRHKNAISANDSFTTTKVNDAIITPSGNVISTHPDDYLIATKTPQTLVGGHGTPTVNFSVIDKSTGIKVTQQKSSYDEDTNTINYEAVIESKIQEFIATSKGDEAFAARDYRLNGRHVLA